MLRLEYLYRYPNLAPREIIDMDEAFFWTYNQFIWDIEDVKKDIARWEES